MRKWRFEPERNSGFAADRHLTDQQLVDVAIGVSSGVGESAIKSHLAVCPRCRDGLDHLRGIDRQLALGGGSRRLAAIPGTAPAPVHGESAAAGALATSSRWHRVAVPLMAAACALFALRAAVKMSAAPTLALDRGAEIAESPVEPFWPVPLLGGPNGTARFYCRQAPSLPVGVAAAPVAVDVNPSAVARVESTDNPSGTSRGFRAPRMASPRVSVATPRRAESPAVREDMDIASRIMSERHPGAGRGDDRISSPPPNHWGV